ncbi:MAG: flavodoxin family protein [Bacillota bacterium]
MRINDVAVIYWSKTGNTKKVAKAIKDGAETAGADVELLQVSEAGDIDYFDYDLICFGSPSYSWQPPEDVKDFLNNKQSEYKERGLPKLGSPRVSGKNVLLFCTYSGPHTGKNEAIPVLKYIGQFFDHLGIEIVDEWYILSEYHASEEVSTRGRMGDIRGLPSPDDLKELKNKTEELIKDL